MSDLKHKTIKLAYEKPELRKHLLPLIKQAASPLQDTVDAFADANQMDGAGPRDLRFRTSQPVSLRELGKILKTAIPNGYNDFKAEKVIKGLKKAPGASSAKYWIAREGSPAIYIQGPAETLKEIAENAYDDLWADEVNMEAGGKVLFFALEQDNVLEDYSKGELRLWWD